MRRLICPAVVIASLCAAPAFADVQLTIHNGLVSLTTHDATVRQILAEWARVGQTKVVNGERAPGGPLTLQLTDIPEAQALDIVLRSVSGYMAAPRPTYLQNASRYDRIVVMPTAVNLRAPSATAQMPSPRLPAAPPPPQADEQEQEEPGRNPGPPQGTVRPPVFTTYPSPEVGQQPQAAPPPAATPTPTMSATPTAPGGVALPGVIAPAPTPAPGQAAPPPQNQAAP
jgi:hypothetical protein